MRDETQVTVAFASVWEKLNLRAQPKVVALGVPPEFESSLAELGDGRVTRDVGSVDRVEFALVFAASKANLNRFASQIIAKATDDPIVWFAYPKATSRRYACDFNRDLGWDILRDAGWDTVRQVAIDEDWTALRFRRSVHIKTSIRRERKSR